MKLSVLLISTFLLTPFGVAGGTLHGSFSPSHGNASDSHIETKNETVVIESNETLSQSLHKTNETVMNVSNETVSQSLHMTSATVSVPPFNASESLLVSAIAWDTAGNMAEEANVTLLVTGDTVAPSALTTFHSSIAFEEDETEIRIVIKFSEPLNTTLDQERFSIQQLRPIIRDVNASLMRLVLQSCLGEVAVSIPVSELGLGQYRVEVDQGFAFDVDGNPSEIVSWEFNVTVASNVRTTIAVIDAFDDSQDYVDARWAEFRAIYPDRPFCLLQPLSDFSFFNIPEVFDGIYSVVNRDNGKPALASNWFTICKLNEINPLIRKNGLFVDNSGSMTIRTVQASLNLFLTKVEEANF